MSIRWWGVAALSLTMLFSWLERAAVTYLLPAIGRTFDWGVADIGRYGGWLFSIFFVGYGIGLLSLGGVAQRVGAMRSLFLIIAASAVVTIAGGVAARSLGASSLGWLLGLRFVLGVAEGAHVPMMVLLVQRWFPEAERARANSWILNAVLFANVVSPWLVLPTAEILGWELTIVMIGIASLLPLPLLQIVSSRLPRRADSAEDSLRSAGPRNIRVDSQTRAILWRLILLGILGNFCSYALFSWMPTYLDHLGGTGTGSSFALAVSIPSVVCAAAVTLFAWAGDRFGRKLLISSVGFVLLAAMAAVVTVPSTVPGAVTLFSAALVGSMAYAAQEMALIQKISPSAITGTIVGWYGGLGMLVGGSLGTYGVGAIVATNQRYDFAMYLVAIAAILAGVVALRTLRSLRY